MSEARDEWEEMPQIEKMLAKWRERVSALPRPPHITGDAVEGVGQLMLLQSRYSTQPDEELRAEIHRTAYALAHTALEDMTQRSVIAAFRDALEAVIADCASPAGLDKPTVRFFDVLSDAYWQAYVDNLKRTIRNQAAENTSKELHLAKYIQQYLLPKKIPALPGYEFAGRLIPAAEVGGDYWSVKYYPEDGIVTWKLADIAGHGIAAATLVAAVKFISGGYYPSAKTAAALMQKTNHVLVKETPSDILVTMVYGWLHVDSGDLNIVNAGHSPIFIQRGDVCIDIEPTGPVLGLAESRYTERRLHLELGDIVFTCSDGVTEARRGKEMFGVERVKRIVSENRNLPAEKLIDAVATEVQRFSGGAKDDVSVVVIRAVEGGGSGRYVQTG